MFSLVSSFECFAKFLSFFSRFFYEVFKSFTKVWNILRRFHVSLLEIQNHTNLQTTSFARRSKPTQQNMGILYTFYIFGINIFVSQSASRFCECKMKIEHPHLYSKALFSWFKYYLNKIDQCAPALRCSIVLGQGLLLYSVVIVLTWSSVSQ